MARRRVADNVRSLQYVALRHAATLHELQQHARRRKRPTVCLLPTDPWFGGALQRPQQLARALARQGVDVLYLERWSLTEADDDTELVAALARERAFLGLKQVAERIHLLRTPPAYCHSCLNALAPDLILLSWPSQAAYIPPNCRSFVAYEMIDDHSLDSRSHDTAWIAAHNTWIEQADIAIASADRLHRSLQGARPDAILLPNAVQLEDWQAGDSGAVPADLAAARKAPVVVGYFGALASWFDADMWCAAAAARPDWSFVLIGGLYDEAGRKFVERAKQQANIYYLKVKPYDQLPHYVRHFDVATIPFQLNPITHACSPVKLFEYMAAGRPIVATRMDEIVKYQSVLFAANAKSFVEQIERAVARRHCSDYAECLRAEAAANTWSRRAADLLSAWSRVREQQNGTPRRFLTSHGPVMGRVA